MKPPPFRYFAPETVEEVLSLLAEHGGDARLLAGGQSLVPLMNLRMARPEVLIDLNRCAELRQIEVEDGGIRYGAMVPQIDAERSGITLGACPLVAKALEHAGPIAVRTRATVGGTLAHADRVAELPGVAIALDATIVLESASGRREVPAADYFLGDLTTSIEPEEMLRAAVFPAAGENAYQNFQEVGLRLEGMAIAGLAAHIEMDGGAVVQDARFAVIGVEPAPVRLSPVEALVRGQELTSDLIGKAAAAAGDAIDPADDAHATAHYRRHVTGAMIRNALEEAANGQ